MTKTAWVFPRFSSNWNGNGFIEAAKDKFAQAEEMGSVPEICQSQSAPISRTLYTNPVCML